MFQIRRPKHCLLPQWCAMCRGGGAESLDHLFLHCEVATVLWRRLFQRVDVCWVCPALCSDLLVIDFAGLGRGPRGVVLWRCAILAVFWVVWLERNERIFEHRIEEVGGLWERVVFLASFWASVASEFSGVPLFLIISDWRAVCGL